MKEESRLKNMLPPLGKLSTLEKKVATYLIKNEENLINLEITTISRETGVSKATIVRFCKALGFNGLKDFKVAYQSRKSQYSVAPKAITKTSSPSEIAEAFQATIIRAVENSLSEENINHVDKLISELSEAGRTYLLSALCEETTGSIIALLEKCQIEVIKVEGANVSSISDLDAPMLILLDDGPESEKELSETKRLNPDKYSITIFTPSPRSSMQLINRSIVSVSYDKGSVLDSYLSDGIVVLLFTYIFKVLSLKQD